MLCCFSSLLLEHKHRLPSKNGRGCGGFPFRTPVMSESVTTFTCRSQVSVISYHHPGVVPLPPSHSLFPHLDESLPSSFGRSLKGDDFSLPEAKICPSWLASIFPYSDINGFTWLNFQKIFFQHYFLSKKFCSHRKTFLSLRANSPPA